MATETLYSRQLRVRVDGAPLPPLETALLWAEVTAVSSAPRVCRLGLSNWGHSGEGLDYLFFESGLLAYGAELEVALEGAEPSGVIFRGQLWGFSAEYPAGKPPEMVLLAYDRLKRLDQEPHTRAFVNQSIADVANQIASEHGLLPSIQLDGPLFPRLVQPGVTDLAFLQSLITRLDGWMGVDGDQFVLRPMLASSQSLSFSYGRNLHEMRLSASLEGIPASLAVTGWNVSQKQAVNASAGLSSQSGETFGLVTGGEISGAALDAWQHINLADWPVAPSAAQHTADAAFRQSARNFVQGEGLCDLHPGLVPAGLVHLEQLGPWFSGAYRVTKVQHSFSPQSGYETRFWVERPGLAGGREILPLRNKAGKPRRTTKTKKARMPRRRRPE